MRINTPNTIEPVTTYEGSPAAHLTPMQALRRTVVTCLLWEDSFYESGVTTAERIKQLVPQCKPGAVAALAIDARDKMHLRHVPLLLVREMARYAGPQNYGGLLTETLAQVIQRPDELTEYLAIYWKDAKTEADKEPLSAASKRGLAEAFKKFNAYSLAKYDQDKAIKLRDVLRLTHAKPKGLTQPALWGQVIKRELPTPDTWETELSAGKDKKATFERLLREDKLGGMAFLKNLRNMVEARVDTELMRQRFDGEFTHVLPFRFITAAQHCKRLETDIERAMLRVSQTLPKLSGMTALVIDTSPSMWDSKVSKKSELTRFDAAAALTIIARECCDDVHIWAFNNKAHEVPARRGFALRDALAATKGSASCGGLAVTTANDRGYDRIIVLTDGEWHEMSGHSVVRQGNALDMAPKPLTDKAYLINVAPYTNTVKLAGRWQSVEGWSEHVLTYIHAMESELA